MLAVVVPPYNTLICSTNPSILLCLVIIVMAMFVESGTMEDLASWICKSWRMDFLFFSFLFFFFLETLYVNQDQQNKRQVVMPR